jgi:polyferredoxin
MVEGLLMNDVITVRMAGGGGTHCNTCASVCDEDNNNNASFNVLITRWKHVAGQCGGVM